MVLQQALILALIGALAGLLGGMLGIGGAVVIIPALVFFLGFSQQSAQGTTMLMLSLPVGALAAFQYYRSGFVELKSAFILAAFFFVGGFFGAKLAVHLPQTVLKKAFGVLLLLLAIKILVVDKK